MKKLVATTLFATVLMTGTAFAAAQSSLFGGPDVRIHQFAPDRGHNRQGDNLLPASGHTRQGDNLLPVPDGNRTGDN